MRDYLQIVEDILTKHPDARDDDFRLYGWVCRSVCPNVMDLSFKQVLWQNNELGLPTYETVTRARRKLQQTRVDLRGKKYYKRQEKQVEYKETYSWR